MTSFIGWYLLVLLFGLVAWPLTFRLLPSLPGRGYTISKALGLLLVGYVLWLFTTFRLLSNSLGGIALALLIVFGVGIWIYQTYADDEATLLSWLKSNWQLVVIGEVLFLLAFAGWAYVRAHSPEIQFTEKPMELAFLNGIRMSDTFPPQDPWLSGYSISYYYFGYVIVAMLAQLSGVSSGVAFNLAIALLFALTALGSYGLIYNMVAHYWQSQGKDARGIAPFTALMAPIFTVLVGNLMGLVDTIHSRAWLPEGFWRWLDIAEVDSRLNAVRWPPTTARPGWWWWRASRVIRERTPTGDEVGIQPIDEFPMFSFILGDMHPHVLILPFIMVVLVLAFHALVQSNNLSKEQIGLYAVSFGALAFLNAWDFPIYGFVLGAMLFIKALHQRGNEEISIVQSISTTVIILCLGILLYLPWYISFSSQAGGILPNLIVATPFQQYFVMFGVFLPIIVLFLVDTAIRSEVRPNWAAGFGLAGGLLATLLLFAIIFGFIVISADVGVRNYFIQSAGLSFDGLTQETARATITEALNITLLHRLNNPVTPLFLTLLLGAGLALLLAVRPNSEEANGSAPLGMPDATLFAILLIVTGALLTLGPEFVYLRDNFGQRINTIFKFYYAAWLLFALGTAYGIHMLIANPKPILAFSSLALTVMLVAAGLLYPAWGIANRTNNFAGEANLDGLAFLERTNPDEYDAIQWLQANADPEDVIIEAVGGAYSDHGRISAATGLQTIIGWDNHQRQWRGDLYQQTAGGRVEVVRQIYSTTDMSQVEELLRRYNVTYIIIGPRERSTDVSTLGGIEKFAQYYAPVYQNDLYTIYRTDIRLLTETTP